MEVGGASEAPGVSTLLHLLPESCFTLCQFVQCLLKTGAFFSVVAQSPSHVRLFATPWTAALQASLSFTVSQSLLKLMSIESVMPSNHCILCPLLLPSIFPSISLFQ